MTAFRSNAAGFTLMEIVTTLGIIALIATFSIPYLQSASQNMNLNAVARDLATDLRYAQQLAVTTQHNHQLIADTSGNSYQIIDTATRVTLKKKQLKSPMTFYSIAGLPGNTVTYNASGAATSSGIIIIKNATGATKSIEIKPSGYVSLY